jgi:hypothetical protein
MALPSGHAVRQHHQPDYRVPSLLLPTALVDSLHGAPDRLLRDNCGGR